MKVVLFVEKDPDISDFVAEYAELHLGESFQVKLASSMNEADEILRRETFDAVIMDALQPSVIDLLDFIRSSRHRDYKLPMVALVGYHDMILNPRLKEELIKAKVSITDKINSLREENIPNLLTASCERGFGEEIC